MNWSELGILNIYDPNNIQADSAYRFYTKEVWQQETIDDYYSGVVENQRFKIPQGPIEVLKIKIPAFSEWYKAFEEVGPWFNIRLLTFNVADPMQNGLV